MADNDSEVLQEAARSVTRIDVRYRRASFNDKVKLKKSRDQAFNAYARARKNLLASGLITTKRDVEAMKKIREGVVRARSIQTLLVAAGRLTSFLTKFV